MKAFLIIGIILFAGGIVFGASKSRPGLSPSQTQINARIVSGSILTGVVLMLASGIIYLRS